MKRTTRTAFILAILAATLVTGCGNPFNQNFPADTDIDTDGSFQLTIDIPNYQEHTAPALSRAISPESRWVEVFLFNGADPGTPILSGRLRWWDADDPESNGFFYTTYDREILVQSGTYDTLEVVLYSDDPNLGGTVLTEGSVSNVTVNPGERAEIAVALTPPEGMFTPLTLGVEETTQSVAGGGMIFYSFDATTGQSYDVAITPTAGAPDVYLFDPAGRRSGVDLAQAPNWTGDRVQTEGATLTFTTYAAEQTGTYYLGVYGWIDPDTGLGEADYSISVATAASPVARPVPEPAPAEGTVSWYVDDAFTNLRNEAYEAALDSFTNALLVTDAESSTEYGVALAGYNALYLMSVAVDPAIVSVARDNLGFADYPSDMSVLFSGQWLQTIVEPDGWEMMFPRIVGQQDLDGDGFLSIDERMIAVGEFFIANNAGFATVANAALSALDNRLSSHIQNIVATDPEVALSFTWDMVYDHLDEIVSRFYYDSGDATYRWPVDDHGNPVEVLLARDDLLVLASMLHTVKSLIHLGMVYELDLSQPLLQGYWDTFNPYDGTSSDDPALYDAPSPFTTGFLGAGADSAEHLGAARDAFVAATSTFESALYGISARAPGGQSFFISPESPMTDVATNWDTTESAMSLAAEEIIPRLADSAQNNTTFYFPVNLIMNGDPEAYRYGSWPVTLGGPIDPEPTIAVNLGRLFSAPFSGVVEMTGNGEPAWYDLAGTQPLAFTEITTAPDDPLAEDVVYVRLPDVTLGGLISVDDLLYVPTDDPATRYRLYLDYWDDNGDGYWTPGEQISQLIYYANIEGLINTAVIDVDLDYPNGDPEAYYSAEPTLASFTDQDLIDAGIVASSTEAQQLRVAVAAGEYNYEPYFSAPYSGGPPIVILRGLELFIGTPPIPAWASLAPAGTTATDTDGYTMTATGSVWTFPFGQW